jgi:chromosome segregation ATPase
MAKEKTQMEADEVKAKAEGEKAEREERQWRIQQAQEAYEQGEQQWRDAKDELELLGETLTTAANEEEKAEIEAQIREIKARKAGLEAAHDAVKGTLEELK